MPEVDFDYIQHQLFDISNYEKVISIIKNRFMLTDNQVIMIFKSSVLRSYFEEISRIISKYLEAEYPIFNIHSEFDEAINYYTSLKFSSNKQERMKEALFIFKVLFYKEKPDVSLLKLEG